MSTLSENLWVVAWKRLRKNKGAVFGLVILTLYIITALFAPLIAPFEPSQQILEYSVKPAMFRGKVLRKHNVINPEMPLYVAINSYYVNRDSIIYRDAANVRYSLPRKSLYGTEPSQWYGEPLFVCGTDRFGRDVLSRLIYGTRVSLTVGLISESIAVVLGLILGALAGYYRGRTDDAIMWLVNVVYSFPSILLVIALSVVLGKGFWQTFVAIGISSWVDIARIVRGQFFSIREQEYIEATRAFGFGASRTIFRHMLPNAAGPIIVLATAGFASAIIAEASLSFIGLGVQPPTASWGQMIKDGYGYLVLGGNWSLTVFPCAVMALAVLALNLFGDGLRDALDPKTSQR
jgi:ABC-type dipeptide/oligopeptide/nickel transport system permease subunit